MSYASARICFAFTAFACIALGGCATQRPQHGSAVTPPSPPVQPDSPSSGQDRQAAQRAVSVALDQVGRPYRYGGADRGGFDCSGLVYFSYGRAGISMPRTTGALWNALTPVRASALETGDVLFFDIEGKVAHVGLYLGDGRFVHAPSSGRTVTVATLDQPYYRQALVRGGRP